MAGAIRKFAPIILLFCDVNMKIKIQDLITPMTLTVTGTEGWLSAIYEGFPVPAGTEVPRLKAHLTLTPDGYGRVDVTGLLEYAPLLTCSRCADPVTWPIQQTFRVNYRSEPVADDREKDLQSHDLDTYYFQNDAINIEELINDLIETNIPTQVLRRSADGNSCAVCLTTLHETLVFETSTQDNEQDNPFAVLKKLKLPQ